MMKLPTVTVLRLHPILQFLLRLLMINLHLLSVHVVTQTPESQSESDKSQKDMFSPVHQTDPATTVVDIASTI